VQVDQDETEVQEVLEEQVHLDLLEDLELMETQGVLDQMEILVPQDPKEQQVLLVHLDSQVALDQEETQEQEVHLAKQDHQDLQEDPEDLETVDHRVQMEDQEVLETPDQQVHKVLGVDPVLMDAVGHLELREDLVSLALKVWPDQLAQQDLMEIQATMDHQAHEDLMEDQEDLDLPDLVDSQVVPVDLEPLVALAAMVDLDR